MAKYYFPGGYDIKELGHEESLHQTNKFLKQENVIIFEVAIKYKNLLIRADILVKADNVVQLIEVKAKSYVNLVIVIQ